MKRKLICILVFCFLFVLFSFSRDGRINKAGVICYDYDTMTEFYKYWNKAAANYNCVFISVLPNFSGNIGPWSTSDIFYYCTETKAVSAGFNNNRLTGDFGDGKYFFLPEQYNEAVLFWNLLIKSM